jgi:DNA invertase Pin-like site-specific DNA recombinase
MPTTNVVRNKTVAVGRFVAYYRVSTVQQGRSGLGLEAQQSAVLDYLNGGHWAVTASYTEVESGKRTTNRPELAKAMATCRMTGATLVIATLDRLSRDAEFLIGLERAGVNFVAADMPNANKLTVGIMALVAQQEREAIARRTKAALVAAKARGVTLGGYKGGPVPDAVSGGAAARAKADAFACQVGPIAAELRETGLTLRAVAAEMTRRGIRTPRDTSWTASGVNNLLARMLSNGIATD